MENKDSKPRLIRWVPLLQEFDVPISSQVLVELQQAFGVLQKMNADVVARQRSDRRKFCNQHGVFSASGYYKLMFDGLVVLPFFKSCGRAKDCTNRRFLYGYFRWIAKH